MSAVARVLITGFADEISPDPREQIAVLRDTGVNHVEVRGVGGKGVLDLETREVEAFCRDLKAAGIRVSAIGSPIGKVQVRADLEAHFARFEIALERARQFEAPYIRVFSFYHEGEEAVACRPMVLEQLTRMVEAAAKAGCTLVHENEKDIYGDVPARCLDLLQTIGHPCFRAVFDAANFIQCQVDPKEQAWPQLAGYVDYFHIKDGLAASGKVVPAGLGDANLEWILGQAVDRGFRGFLSLEPHLKADDPVYGGSGAERFARAVAALRQVLGRLGVEAG